MTRPLLAAHLPLFAAALLAGCGGGNQVPIYDVTGEVVYPDGSPLPFGGIIQFRSGAGDTAQVCSLVFGKDGKFSLSSDSPGRRGEAGLPEGECSAIVLAEVPDNLDGLSKAERALAIQPTDVRFKNYRTSGLQFNVSSDASQNNFRIEVTRPRR